MRLSSSLLHFFVLLVAADVVFAQEAQLDLLKKDVSAYEPATTRSVPVADFDGDGLLDVVVPKHNFNESVVSIVGTGSQLGWRTKQSLVAHEPGNANWPIGVAAGRDRTGAYLVLTKDSRIFIYGGWPLRMLRILDVQAWQPQAVAVADIDTDGDLEIVSATAHSPATLTVHDLHTGALEWRTTIPGFAPSVITAQLDSDAALEILAGGFVFDGATKATQWHYKDGFGLAMATGRFGSGLPRFVTGDHRIVMFQAAPWSPLWDVGDKNIESIAVVDVDGDGIDELVHAGTFGRRAEVFDVQLRQTRRHYQPGNVYRVAAGDFDGDGSPEVALLLDPRAYGAGPAHLQIVDAATGALEHSIAAVRAGPYAAALFKAGDEVRMAQASRGGSFPAGLPGLLRAAAVSSSEGAWSLPAFASPDLMSAIEVQDLHATRLDGQAGPILIATGRSAGQRVMAAFRGEDGSRLWTRTHGSAAGSQYFERSLPFDRNGDGTADSMFVCTNQQRIQEYRLADGALLWESVEMPLTSCNSLFLTEINGSRNIVGVFWLGVRAFDVDTRLLTWSLPGFGNAGGSLIENGLAGAEMAIFDSRSIEFYDVASRDLLRTVDLNWQLGGVHQPQGASIHFLVVLEDSRLKVIDGVSGQVRAASDPMGLLSANDTLTSLRISDHRHIVSVGAGVGAFAYQLKIAPDGVFSDGFDRWITPQPIPAR